MLELRKINAEDLGRPTYRVRNPLLEGKLYVFHQPLYDFYGAVVAVLLVRQTLFQAPIGQNYTPVGGTAFAKTEWHTNMTAAGQLPQPQKFYCKAVTLWVRSDIVLADAHRFLADTLLDLRISNTSYIKQEAFRFPAGSGAFGNSSGLINNGLAVGSDKGVFITYGDVGETIEQAQSVAVELDPTRVIDGSGATTMTTATAANGGSGINAKVHLDGLLHREVK